MRQREQNRQADWRRGQSGDRQGGAGYVSRKIWAGLRSGEDGLAAGCGLGYKRRHTHGHGAMMRSVTAAAGRQARVVFAGWENGRKRPEPEEQNQEGGNPAPHLEPMLHDCMAIK